MIKKFNDFVNEDKTNEKASWYHYEFRNEAGQLVKQEISRGKYSAAAIKQQEMITSQKEGSKITCKLVRVE